MHNEIPISSPTCAVEERGPKEEGSGGREGGREREERKFCPGMSDEDDFDIVTVAEVKVVIGGGTVEDGGKEGMIREYAVECKLSPARL